jgi:hypothetical protein
LWYSKVSIIFILSIIASAAIDAKSYSSYSVDPAFSVAGTYVVVVAIEDSRAYLGCLILIL